MNNEKHAPGTAEATAMAWLNEKACCTGTDCACRGVTRLQRIVQEEIGSRQTAPALPAVEAAAREITDKMYSEFRNFDKATKAAHEFLDPLVSAIITRHLAPGLQGGVEKLRDHQEWERDQLAQANRYLAKEMERLSGSPPPQNEAGTAAEWRHSTHDSEIFLDYRKAGGPWVQAGIFFPQPGFTVQDFLSMLGALKAAPTPTLRDTVERALMAHTVAPPVSTAYQSNWIVGVKELTDRLCTALAGFGATAQGEDPADSQWYPVSDMLPLNGERVLFAWVRGKDEDSVTIRTGYHLEGKGFRGSGNVTFKTNPTHFRMLPKVFGKAAMSRPSNAGEKT